MTLCEDCSSQVELNNANWHSQPYVAWFVIDSNQDTFFTLDLIHIDETQDPFQDLLNFWKIPFNEGVYLFTDSLHSEHGTLVGLNVYEFEYGTPSQRYMPLYNGSSSISIDFLDKSTDSFALTFNIQLFPNGDVNGPIMNNSYPQILNFQGKANGTVTFE